MPTTDTVHRELCHALFDALEHGDVAGVERCYAPDMTMWFNVTGADISRDENLAAVTRGVDLHRRRTYDDRTINTFDDGFVARYTLGVVLHDGSRRSLSACLVGRCRDGRITRIDEYMDSSKFGAWAGVGSSEVGSSGVGS